MRQRIWACTAVAVAGGLLGSGQNQWSAQTVFAGCALWLLFGLLLGQAGVGAVALGRLGRGAAALPRGGDAPALPYAGATSPAARLRLALTQMQTKDPAQDVRRSLVLGVIAGAAALVLASFFARPVSRVVGITLVATLVLGALSASESAINTLLAAAAWSAGIASLGLLRAPLIAVGVLGALLLCAATHPNPRARWRVALGLSGLALSALFIVARQPALAGLLLVYSLAGHALPLDNRQPLALQLAAGLSVLLTGLAARYWG